MPIAYTDPITNKLPLEILPFVGSTYEEYINLATFPSVGISGKLYFALDSKKLFRWIGSGYEELVSTFGLQNNGVVINPSTVNTINFGTGLNQSIANGILTLTVAAGSGVASGIAFNPTSTITANNVQTAIVQVDTNKVAKSGDSITGDLIYSATNAGTPDANSTDPLKHFSSRIASFRTYGNYINHAATDEGNGRINGPIRPVDMRLFQESFITNAEPNTSLIFDNYEPNAEAIADQAIANPSYVVPPVSSSPYIAFNYLRGPVTVTTQGVAEDKSFWLRDFVRRFHRGTVIFVNDPDPAKREKIVIKNSNFALNDQFIAPFKYSHAKDTPLYVIRDMVWDLAADGTIIRPNSSSSVEFNIGAQYFGRFSRVGNTSIYGWTRHFGSQDIGHHIGFPYFAAFSASRETNVPRFTMTSGEFKVWVDPDPNNSDILLPNMYVTGTYDVATTNALFTLYPQGSPIDDNFVKITVGSFVILGTKSQKDYQIVKVTAVNQTTKTFTANTSYPTPINDTTSPVTGGIRIQPVKSTTCSTQFVNNQLNIVLSIPSADMAMFDVSDWVWYGDPIGANGTTNSGKFKITAKDTLNNTITVDRAFGNSPTGTYYISPYATALSVFNNTNVQFKSGNEFGVTFLDTTGGSAAEHMRIDYKNKQVIIKKKISLQGISGDGNGFIFFDNKTSAATVSLTITSGVITAATPINRGGIYTVTPAVTITGDGTGAAITAVLTNGIVTGYTITNGGTGYTTAIATVAAPTVTGTRRTMFEMNLTNDSTVSTYDDFNFFLKTFPNSGSSFNALEINRQTGGLFSYDQIYEFTGVDGAGATVVDYNVALKDYQINVNKTTASATNIVLPKTNQRIGKSYIIKDVKGDAQTNNITISVEGGGSIDNVPNYVITTNRGWIRVAYRAFGTYIITGLGSQGTNITTFAATDATPALTATGFNKTFLLDSSALTGGNVNLGTVNLPSANNLPVGLEYEFTKTDTSINPFTIDPNGSQTIDGLLTYVLYSKDQSITIRNNGTGWITVDKNGKGLRTFAASNATPTITATTGTDTIFFDSSALTGGSTGAGAVTLTSALTSPVGYEITITKIDTSSNIVTINPTGGQTINGQTSYVLYSKDQSVTLRNNGANWIIVRLPNFGTRTITVTTTLSYSDNTILGDPTGGSFTLNLPAVANVIIGKNYFIRNIAAANTVTLDPNAAETINGSTTLVLNPGEKAIINYNGTSWYSF